MTGSSYDVIVIGGGTAGVVAAVQAGRAGARALLVERAGTLGGTVTLGGIPYPGRFAAWGRQVIGGIGWELVARTRETAGQPLPEEAAREHVGVDRFLYAMICDEAIVEAEVDLLLHSMVAGVSRDADRWRVVLCTKTGLEELTTTVLVDCTGDANAVALAGCELRDHERLQPGTLSFRLAGYDVEALDLDAIDDAFRAEVAAGRLRVHDATWNAERNRVRWILQGRGENANHLPGVNAADSLGRTEMELSGRASVLRLFRFLKAQPGLEHLKFEYVSPEVGIRETTTIVGKTTITEDDYESGRVWEDAVCYAFYGFDEHILEGRGINGRPLADGIVPTIPRRALLPAGSENLLVAGRCLSSDRMANSALRVEAPCMAMGQAAGALGALAAATETEVERIELAALDELLAAHGAIVPDRMGAT